MNSPTIHRVAFIRQFLGSDSFPPSTLSHRYNNQRVIEKKEPGSTWHWPAWLAPGLPHRFPSTWSRTSTPQMNLWPQWFFLPATDMVNTFCRKNIWGYLQTPVKTPRSDLFSWMSLFGSRLIFRVGPRTLPFLLQCSSGWELQQMQNTTCSFFCLSLSSKALISSGQSRFSRGSHVFSSGPKPFQER